MHKQEPTWIKPSDYKVEIARQYDREPPDGWEWVYNVGSLDSKNLPTAFPFAKAKPQPTSPECELTSEQLVEMGLVGIYRQVSTFTSN